MSDRSREWLDSSGEQVNRGHLGQGSGSEVLHFRSSSDPTLDVPWLLNGSLDAIDRKNLLEKTFESHETPSESKGEFKECLDWWRFMAEAHPSSMELAEFIEAPAGSDKDIADHLAICSSCRSLVPTTPQSEDAGREGLGARWARLDKIGRIAAVTLIGIAATMGGVLL